MTDDYISSYFSKERRWYKNNKSQLDDTYPFDRVVTFLRDVRKQGLTSDGYTFLDRLRTLLSEIGNAMGFVRMARSARMNYCSEAMQYIPERDENWNKFVISLKEKESNCERYHPFSNETCTSINNVNKIISTLVDDEMNDNYVKMLLEVFQNVLSESTHDHLDNFYIMIPALSLSWMDASIRAKEMCHKKNRTRDAYYTDDGFATGTAFMLSILEQNNHYKGLQWEASVKKKFDVEARQISEKKTMQEEKATMDGNISNPVNLFSFSDAYGGDDDEDRDLTTLKVTEKRVEKHQQEMELLFFSLSSSRVFFRN